MGYLVREAADLLRTLTRVVITTFGNDFATATCESRRNSSGLFGRQMQTWARVGDGWHVVAAHVSLFEKPLPAIPPA